MSKRIMSICLVILILVGITACGGKPRGMSDNAYEVGKNAVNVAEDYLSGVISADTASEKLRRLYDQIPKSDDESIYDISIRSSILFLQLQIGNVDKSWHTTTTADVRDELNKLKEKLNLK